MNQLVVQDGQDKIRISAVEYGSSWKLITTARHVTGSGCAVAMNLALQPWNCYVLCAV
jgi:hypothetical protein